MAEAVVKKPKKPVNMTKGPIAKTIFFFALPMFLGNLFQQVYNMVDSVVVGNFVGPEALGAVGSTFPIVFVAIAVSAGLGMGCSVVMSQYLGAKDYGKVRMAITTSLIFNLIVSLALSVLGMIFCRPMLQLMNTPAETIGMASDYLFIYFAGISTVFMYNTVAGTFRALGDSKTPLYYLILSSILNVGLDLLFVIQFDMGVAGVAIATVIAQTVCLILSYFHLMRRVRQLEKAENHKVFDTSMLSTIVRLAVPSMFQQLSVSISSLLFQSIINGFGPMVISGYTAANKVEAIAFMPIMSLGMACSTYVAQNIGAGNIERVKKGVRSCILMGTAMTVLMFTLLQVFGPYFIGFFVDTATGGEVVTWGTYHLTRIAFILFIEVAMFVGEGLLKGAGDMNMLMFTTITGMVLRTIAVFILVGHIGFAAIWISMGFGCLIETGIAFWRYFQGGWKEKAITFGGDDDAPGPDAERIEEVVAEESV